MNRSGILSKTKNNSETTWLEVLKFQIECNMTKSLSPRKESKRGWDSTTVLARNPFFIVSFISWNHPSIFHLHFLIIFVYLFTFFSSELSSVSYSTCRIFKWKHRHTNLHRNHVHPDFLGFLQFFKRRKIEEKKNNVEIKILKIFL